MYCPECGTDHHAGERQAEEAVRAEVDIARIQADRDVAIAKLTAASGVKIAEAEAESDTAHAEGKVEGMETVIEAGAAPEVIPDGDPIVVEAPEPEPEPEPVIEEPPAPEPVIEPEPKRGYWDAYR